MSASLRTAAMAPDCRPDPAGRGPPDRACSSARESEEVTVVNKCPYCAESVPLAAERCPACGETLARQPGAAPPKKGLSTLAIVAIVAGGCLFLFVPFVAVVAAIAIPNLIEARKHGNEAAAIGGLRTLCTAQVLYREGDKDGDGKLNYAPGLAQLGATSLIDPILAGGLKQGYRYQLAASSAAPERRWVAVASPMTPGTTGDRHFMVDQDGVVYESPTPFPLDPDASSPPPTAQPVGSGPMRRRR
jgi:type IV pilus assembly protein PilA